MIEDFFGDKNVVPSIDLASHAAYLCRVLGERSPFGVADDLIERTTLYPYHRPFLSRVRHEQAKEMMLHSGISGLKTLIGRVANRFGANTPLRSCLECAAEDLERHGCIYWRRTHQLPAVVCCLTHKKMLVVQAYPKLFTDRQSFVSPAMSSLGSDTPSSTHLIFATLSTDLLHAGLVAIDPTLRSAVYRDGVGAMGHVDRRGRIDYVSLAKSLDWTYKNFAGFPHQERLLKTGKEEMAWVRPLLSRPERSLHPICHLLLIGYIFRSIGEYKEAIRALSFGRDAGFEKSNAAPAEATKTTTLRSHPLLHDAGVSSRILAKSLNLSVNTVVLHRRALGVKIPQRYKKLNEDLITAIAHDLSRGERLKVVAEKHGVSVSTISRIRGGYPVQSQTDAIALQDGRDKRRSEWKQAIRISGDAGVSVARAIAPASYAWLYRNDRPWLNENCSRFRALRHKAERVDWKERDKGLSDLVQAVAAQAYADPKRRRVSKTLLVRALGETMIRVNRNKLPHLMTMIEQLSESHHSYQAFRVERAIQSLSHRGVSPVLWRIQRVAGLKHWTPDLRAIAGERIRQHERQALRMSEELMVADSKPSGV